MRILSRYIINRFSLTLIGALSAFVGIYVVVDLVEHIDTFIDRGISAGNIARYYLYYLPYIAVLMLPAAMLIASLFSIAGLARRNELVAMKSSGISLYRVLFPLFRFAFLISLLALVVSEVVVPEANQRKEEIRTGKRKVGLIADRENVLLQDVDGQFVSAEVYRASKKLAINVSIQKYRGISLIRRIDADTMVWEDGMWVLKNGIFREFRDRKERAFPFSTLRVKGLTLRSVDFGKLRKKPEQMGFFELKNYIERGTKLGRNMDRWVVELNLKLSFPFTNLIIVLFGAPLASRIRRTGKAVEFGIGLFICFLYYSTIRSSQALGLLLLRAHK